MWLLEWTFYLIVLSLYALWILYAFAMGILRGYQQGTVSLLALILASPVVALAIAWDVVVNLPLFTLLLWDVPKEWTLSGRLSRLAKIGGWKARTAEWMERNFLGFLDPSGRHIERHDSAK